MSFYKTVLLEIDWLIGSYDTYNLCLKEICVTILLRHTVVQPKLTFIPNLYDLPFSAEHKRRFRLPNVGNQIQLSHIDFSCMDTKPHFSKCLLCSIEERVRFSSIAFSLMTFLCVLVSPLIIFRWSSLLLLSWSYLCFFPVIYVKCWFTTASSLIL